MQRLTARLDIDLRQVAAGLVGLARASLDVSPVALPADQAYRPLPRLPLGTPRPGLETVVLAGRQTRVVVARLGLFPLVEGIALAVGPVAGAPVQLGVLTVWPHKLTLDDGGGASASTWRTDELDAVEARLQALLRDPTDQDRRSAQAARVLQRYRRAWEHPLGWLFGSRFTADHLARLGSERQQRGGA